ncbi:MAG TPA: anaerobic glycerol-3-phosphate dehydrogenase subunit GlpB [Candidatus Limnocylindrales bacterium]
MATADVAVAGAGLAGLTAAIRLAQAGARVQVMAAGHATTHWAPGGIDLGALPDSTTSQDAIERLATTPGHPYAVLAVELPAALAWLRATLALEGLDLVGEPGDPLRAIPTAIGATRLAAILPAGMAAALPAWEPDETLVICGPAGFRDYWPEAIAAALRRPSSWRGQATPGRIEAVTVELPDLAGRRNLSSLDLAWFFDDPAWRQGALEAIARAVAARSTGPGRVALPAILGLNEHPAVLAAAREILPLIPFEVALAPPSVPGLRLFAALRAALRRHGGRLQVGEAVHGTIAADGRVAELRAPAAAREFVLAAGAFVLATGGIAGGGIVADGPGILREAVLGLPVEGPPAGDWLSDDAFSPAGHPLETAGIRTDAHLRPVAPGRSGAGARPVAENVRVVGSLLAGQRYLRERCGDGVALASGIVAARELAGGAR